MNVSNLIYLKVAILGLLAIFVIYREKGLKLYHPAVLISIVYFLEYGLPSLTMFAGVNEITLFHLLEPEDLNIGLNFIIPVLVMFLLGFYSIYLNKSMKDFVVLVVSKIPNVNNYTFNIKNFNFVLILLLVIGWISRVLIIYTGNYFHFESGLQVPKAFQGLQAFMHYFSLGSIFPVVTIALIFLEWLKSKNKFYLLLVFVLMLLELAYAIPSGSKEKILFPLALPFFIYSLKHKLPIFPILIGVIFFFLFVFPFMGIYRSLPSTGDIFVNLSRALNQYINIFNNASLKSIGDIFGSILSDRLNYSYIVSRTIKYTPEVWDYKLGYSYIFFFIAIVPRLIWHNKPAISIWANDFGRDYGFISPVDYWTSIDMTWVGEMFVNFGWFGILAGFLYGLFYRLIYTYYFSSTKLTVLSVFFYVFTLYYMVRGSMFTIQSAGVVKTYLILLILFSPFVKKISDSR